MILRYDTIYTIHTLYRTIHEHLQYADTIQYFLHMIRIAYRTILTTIFKTIIAYSYWLLKTHKSPTAKLPITIQRLFFS